MKQTSVAFPEKICELANSAFFEFSCITDYIWKSPRLLEHETTLEKKKLDLYFSRDTRSADLRWKHESRKLTNIFPYHIAVGNLFSAAALFESYMLLLANLLQDHSGILIGSVKGLGVKRLFSYFKLLGFAPSQVPLFGQVNCGIRIRNCFAHAGGMLAWSRDRKELIKLESSRIYLSPDDRKRRKTSGNDFGEVFITVTPYGAKLQINNDYSYIVSCYFRDYFLKLCNIAEEKFVRGA
jgi:hypothetical protein